MFLVQYSDVLLSIRGGNMTVMGERSTEDWTEEFRRTGRVVFPLRRRPLLWQFGYGCVVLVILAAYWVPHAERVGLGERHALLVGGVVWMIGFVGGAWQWVVQRPTLAVDHEGIRRGRKFIAWGEIGAIGIATGPVWARTLPIIPRDTFAKDLRLSAMHVRDLPTFRRWLEELLAERREPSS
jgi:hypothetical protein